MPASPADVSPPPRSASTPTPTGSTAGNAQRRRRSHSWSQRRRVAEYTSVHFGKTLMLNGYYPPSDPSVTRTTTFTPRPPRADQARVRPSRLPVSPWPTEPAVRSGDDHRPPGGLVQLKPADAPPPPYPAGRGQTATLRQPVTANRPTLVTGVARNPRRFNGHHVFDGSRPGLSHKPYLTSRWSHHMGPAGFGWSQFVPAGMLLYS